MRMKSVGITAVTLILASNAYAADFISLGSVYTDPMGSSSGWSISGNGSTVVGYLNVANEVTFPICPECGTYTEYTQTAYSWDISSSTVTLLPFSNATDVSYDGSVVVGDHYRWTSASGAQDLGTLGTGASAYGVSEDGSVVVGMSDGPDGREAFRWTESGGMQGLGFLPAANNLSRASDVSADGSVVVGSGYGGAFIWTEATGMELLATMGPLNEPFHGQPNAISPDGSTVVGQSPETWIWNEASGIQYLGMNQPAYGASADGSIVVGGDQWSSSSGISWIWDETNGVRSLQEILETEYALNLDGWLLYAALGVSEDGSKITGVGLNPLGESEAWFVDLSPSAVPVPAAAWLFGSGLLGLIGMARRKKA